MGTGHAQHAAVLVFGPLAVGIRVQHLEIDAVPVPAQAALAKRPAPAIVLPGGASNGSPGS